MSSHWTSEHEWRDPNCIECGGQGAPCCEPPDHPWPGRPNFVLAANYHDAANWCSQRRVNPLSMRFVHDSSRFLGQSGGTLIVLPGAYRRDDLDEVLAYAITHGLEIHTVREHGPW